MVKMAIFLTKFSIRFVVCLRVVFVTHFISPQLYCLQTEKPFCFPNNTCLFCWGFFKLGLGVCEPEARNGASKPRGNTCMHCCSRVAVCTARSRLSARSLPLVCCSTSSSTERWVTSPEGLSRSVRESRRGGCTKANWLHWKRAQSLTANFFPKYWS